MSTTTCDVQNSNNVDTMFGLRIGAIFVILIASCCGALFPVLSKRNSWLQVHKGVFEFAKFFGSGVIIGTAFIHLLASGVEQLGSSCLSPAWREYPYSIALCMLSVFFIFIVELLAFRLGTAKLEKLGLSHDPRGHGLGSHAAHGLEIQVDVAATEPKELPRNHIRHDIGSEVVGIAILEFGVVLHSILIGMTLSVNQEFKVLFVVILFHQTFEGLGLGSRLATVNIAALNGWIPVVGALLYGVTTPIGMAIGLGMRSSYNPGSTTAAIVTGVMDSLSAGILLYTGIVELLAHEFLFNQEMINSSGRKLSYALICMLVGCGVMALLGRWA